MYRTGKLRMKVVAVPRLYRADVKTMHLIVFTLHCTSYYCITVNAQEVLATIVYYYSSASLPTLFLERDRVRWGHLFIHSRKGLFGLICLSCKGWIQSNCCKRGICVRVFILISCCQGLLIPDCSENQGEWGESQNANFHVLDALESPQFCCLFPLPSPKLCFQKHRLQGGHILHGS